MSASNISEASGTPIVELRNISKHFGSVIALSGVTVSIHPGECHCLLGDNGAGKSTFIKTMSGVHAPTSGEILLDGKPTRLRNARSAIEAGIATVYQDLAMIPLMSVTRNFWMGREPVRGVWPLRFFDADKAGDITMQEMARMGARHSVPPTAAM